ncbi:MAG TPA: ribonuclease J [Chloroflexia bacterium]|nr:ribonuclease J [Chloroflexia bacterium]
MATSTEKVRIIPLGGLGEVGKNMTVLEYGDDIIIVDIGVAFPEAEQFGVDLVIPDITYLKGKEDRIRGIFITHGHEDHIGSIPFIYPYIPAPIYSTRLALGLIEVKLREHNLMGMANLHTVRAGDKVDLGNFVVEFFHVCHSIPDACGLAIHTPQGIVIHTGDFKFDQTPVDGHQTDFAALARLGTEGVLCLLSDCVRVETPGFTPSEREVSVVLDRLIREAPGRVIISTFGSLISRVQQIMDIAYYHHRKVAVAGRSLENNVAMAQELGYLHVPPSTLVNITDVGALHDDEVVLITTGAQGEPMAALSRIANGDHRFISIVPGDTVILSATPIPGNENSVNRIINSLFTQGANVIYPPQAQVHVSGHASQEELKLMINLTRPRFVAPIHGERRHQVHYARLAEQMGVPHENIFLIDNGSVLEVDATAAEVTGKVPAGEVFVDGLSVGTVGQVVIRDRQFLSRDGMLIVVISVDKATGAVLAGPDIVTRGFVYARESEDLLERTRARVLDTLNGHSGNGNSHRQENHINLTDWSFLNRKIKDAVSQYLYEQTRRRPMVLPVVMEL